MSKRSNAANVSLVKGDAGVADAKDLLAISAASGIEGMLAASAPKGIQSAAPVVVGDSDITDELAKGGPALGALVTAMGGAIVESQKGLDENLVKTAKALSETEVEILAIYEQILDDDGKMSGGNAIMQKTPLLSMVPLAVYAFTEAKLVVDMQVSEFNSANGFNVKSKAASASANVSAGYSRWRGFNVGGGASGSTSSSEVSGGSSYGQDYAAGQVHLEVTLQPRTVTTPPPLIIQKGPTVSLSVESIEDLDASGNAITGTAAVAIRRATIRADVRKADGSANDLKELSAVLDQPTLTYSFRDASGQSATKTASDGTIRLRVDRAGSALTASPMPTNVNVRLGLAGDSARVNL